MKKKETFNPDCLKKDKKSPNDLQESPINNVEVNDLGRDSQGPGIWYNDSGIGKVAEDTDGLWMAAERPTRLQSGG
jgi:hypothetical protein